MAAVSVEIKKAFDTIYRNILFIKLYKYDIILNLIKSHFYNRKKSCQI